MFVIYATTALAVVLIGGAAVAVFFAAEWAFRWLVAKIGT